LRLRFLPKIWVRLCGCARFTEKIRRLARTGGGPLCGAMAAYSVARKSSQAGDRHPPCAAIGFIHSLHLKLAVHRPDHFGRVDAYLPAGQLIEGSGGQQALTWSRVAPRRSRRSNALFETGTCIPFSEVPAYWTRTLTHCLDGLGFVCNFNGVVADRPV
jgi:hypothetical protein